MTDVRRVEMLMGTAVDIDVRGAGAGEADLQGTLDGAFERLRDIERTFSTYREDSEISRLGRGGLTIDECSGDVRFIVDLAEKVRSATNGYFDIYAAARTAPAADLQPSDGPRGRPLEPSGVVKGWAIEQVVDQLRNAGLINFCVNAGGDVFASGELAPGRPWRVGVQHPFEKLKVMATLEVRDTAIATSATYERGAHIVRPDGSPPSGLVSVTIVGADITLADAYATAAFAMGRAGMAWAGQLAGFDVFAVDDEGMTHRSAGMNAYLRDASESS